MEEAAMSKMYAREASRRVKVKLDKDRKAQEEILRRQLEREEKLHAPKPKLRLRVSRNLNAALFSAEQKKLNELRRLRTQKEREEWEQQQWLLQERETQEEEMRRLREKEERLENIRRKKEEQQKLFERSRENLKAGQRAAFFQKQHPELLKSKSAPYHPRRYSQRVEVLPGIKEAAERVRAFKKQEEEKRLREKEEKDGEEKMRRNRHKANMLKIKRQRSLSCSRLKEEKKPQSGGDIDQKLEEIRKKIEQLRNFSRN